jgi:hypothetical protein
MLLMPEKRRIIIDSTANAAVRKCIPHAKTVLHDGKSLVAVPYGVDEAMVLKNLGFNVPAPIQHYYDWPARFEPMAHQRDTAAFLTMNKRALCLNAPASRYHLCGLRTFC